MDLLCDNVANVRSLAIGRLAGGEQMVGLLRLRFAAGVCVLAAGLLMGAGARSPLPIPIPAVPPRTARTPASSLPPARKTRRKTARTPRTKRKTARTPRTKERRHGHQGRKERRHRAIQVARRQTRGRSSPRSPDQGRAGLQCGRAGPRCGRAGSLNVSRRFRTCSARLPVRSSRSRNCRPTFTPSWRASPGWRQFLMSSR